MTSTHTGAPEPAAVITPAAFTVSLLPPDNVTYRHYQIEIRHMPPHGPADWAVIWPGFCTLSADGTWDDDPHQSTRDEEWLATHRFTLPDAAALARRHAGDLEANGVTARDAAARAADRGTVLRRDRGQDTSNALRAVRAAHLAVVTARRDTAKLTETSPAHSRIRYDDEDADLIRGALAAADALLAPYAPNLPENDR